MTPSEREIHAGFKDSSLGRTRPKLSAEVDWWDRTRAEYITITITIQPPPFLSVPQFIAV